LYDIFVIYSKFNPIKINCFVSYKLGLAEGIKRTNKARMAFVVMPYDKKNKNKNRAGSVREKWPSLLQCFGKNNPLEEQGWSQTAQRIQETNPKHQWNLEGLNNYTANPQLKCDPELSIFKHIQEVFEDSSTTLAPVVPIAYLSSPQRYKAKIMEDSNTFSDKQVEALLVMAFFCTFPFRNSNGEMPGINFNTLYEAMDSGAQRHQAANAKMDCIWQYFATRTYEERHMRQEREIKFTRRSMRDFPTWGESKKFLSSVTFADYPMEEIAEYVGQVLEVDFANKMIGGGILGSGSVQEEIRMAISPEMIVARLFTAPLEDNEVLFIKGAKQFSRTSGYSNSLKFEEHYIDMEMREVVAMDAREYIDKRQQFERKEYERELNKAFCAFYSKSWDKTKIATGHWGCGAFGGDKELKAILQLLAASEAGRDIIYCLPGADFQKQFWKTVEILHRSEATIGQVFRAVNEFDPDGGSSLFAWLEYKFYNRK